MMVWTFFAKTRIKAVSYLVRRTYAENCGWASLRPATPTEAPARYGRAWTAIVYQIGPSR